MAAARNIARLDPLFRASRTNEALPSLRNIAFVCRSLKVVTRML